MENTAKTLGFLSLPIALTTVAYLLFLNVSNLPSTFTWMLQYLSYIFFMIGMVLGSRFNKSKVFFLCLILGSSQLFLSKDFMVFSSLSHKLPDILDVLSLLIPINFLLFSLFKERGIFTLWGKMKFGFITAQALLIWFLLESQNHALRLLIHYKLLNFNFIELIPMPQISVLLFFIVILFLCVRLYMNPTLMDSSLIGAVVMTFIGLSIRNHVLGLHIFYGMLGLILIIGVIETSYFMAYRDELTGIPGRRALKESMMKLGGKYVIAMLDIDFFKKFNDTYGHDAGDEVLQMVASNLQKVAGGGKAFRFGGEEFTILFNNKTKEEVLPHLEELRKTIAQQKHIYKKKRKVNGKETVVSKQLSVTISIGVAEKNDKLKDVEEVVQAADKALYRAKKNGRNCVSK